MGVEPQGFVRALQHGYRTREGLVRAREAASGMALCSRSPRRAMNAPRHAHWPRRSRRLPPGGAGERKQDVVRRP